MFSYIYVYIYIYIYIYVYKLILLQQIKEDIFLKACDSNRGKIPRDLLRPIKDTGKYCAYFMLAVREYKWRPDYHFN